jgi:hypothetical protein
MAKEFFELGGFARRVTGAWPGPPACPAGVVVELLGRGIRVVLVQNGAEVVPVLADRLGRMLRVQDVAQVADLVISNRRPKEV